MDLAVLSLLACYLMMIAVYVAVMLYQCSCICDQRTIHPEELAMVPVVHQEQGQIQEV